MRLLSQLGFAAVLVAMSVGGWLWTGGAVGNADGKGGARGRSGPVVVETATARLGLVAESIEAVGTTRARNAIDVVPISVGQITRIAFDAGRQVAAGELLVELDADSERAAVSEAESELNNMRLQVERARSLLNRKLTSRAELDDLESQLRVAEARLQAARSRLEKRQVRAPFAGVVGLKNVSLGDYVDTDTVLTTLDDLSVVELDFEIPERFFAMVKREQRVSAASAAFPDRLFSGRVRDIDTRINAASRAFRVRAELPNSDAVLPDGLFMTVSLTIAERPAAVLVPEEAVIGEDNQRYVYVVRDGAAQQVAIEIGSRVDGAVEVSQGLAAGAIVVTKGHQKLRDGAEVDLAQHNGRAPRTDSPS